MLVIKSHSGTQHHTSLDAKLHVACHSHHFGGGILISRAYRRRPCGYLKDFRTPSVVSYDSGHGVRNLIYLINSKILLTKPHSGIAVLMLSYMLPIRWQCHAVISDHTVSKLSPTTPNHTCNYNINILVGLGQRFIQQRWSGNPKLARNIPFIQTMQLINYKILVTKPHLGIIVLMLSYLLPIRWQCHTVVSDHTI